MDLPCITSLPITGLCSAIEALIPSQCVLFSFSPIAALTVPHPLQSPLLLNTHTHTQTCTHTHTHAPTDFQNKTRLFTKPENPERNHILPFKGCLKSPHRCCCLPFFIFISCKRFSPCSFPHLAQHSVTLLHFPSTFPHPSNSVPMITGRKFYPAKRHLLKSCWGSLSRGKRNGNQMLNLKGRCLVSMLTFACV